MASNLIGEYQFTNSTLNKVGDPSVILVISNRKKPSAGKPKYYLLHRLSPNQHKYISSLYEGQERQENGFKTYFLEYEGSKYCLQFTDTKTVRIQPLPASKPKKVDFSDFTGISLPTNQNHSF
jgi:hypothetical protein